MGASRQRFQHAERVLLVLWLPEHPTVHHDDRVGGDHDTVRPAGRDRASFPLGQRECVRLGIVGKIG